jgi:DNA-binding XRE family transcriptional regulator
VNDVLKSRIKIRLIELNNKKQKDLAEELNVKPQTLSGWVRGANKPSLEQAFRIAKALDCKVDDLWELED